MTFEVVRGSTIVRRHRSLRAAIQSWREVGEEEYIIILQDKGRTYYLDHIKEDKQAVFTPAQEKPLIL